MPQSSQTNQIMKYFTAFQVSKICGVYPSTVVNWINRRKLKAHQTQGGHRRILIGDLSEFMKRFDMPIPENLISRRKRALVVEDNPATQRLLARCLQALPDVEIQTCIGGLEALIAIGKEVPDLLTLDLNISEINGFKVCKVLKASQHTREIRIIIVSGEILTTKQQRFIKGHADGYFSKPFSIASFRDKVMRSLDLNYDAGP